MKREQPKTPKGGVTKQPCVWMVEFATDKPGPWLNWDFRMSRRNAHQLTQDLNARYNNLQFRIRKYIRADK